MVWDVYISRMVWGVYISRMVWGVYISRMVWGVYISRMVWGVYIIRTVWGVHITCSDGSEWEEGGLVQVPALEMLPDLLVKKVSCIPGNATVLGNVMLAVDCFVSSFMPICKD
jgi:hypothetical protein